MESEYAKSNFDTESEIICDVNFNKHSNKEFEIKGIKYLVNVKDLDDFLSQSTDTDYRN